jgi:hypothetical protein
LHFARFFERRSPQALQASRWRCLPGKSKHL